MNVPAPLAVGACLVSHIFRSAVAPDLASTFAVELQTFRAEISEAKLALSRSTLILEHCQTQTGILYFGIKFLALTEICLLVWLGWLLWDRRRLGRRTPLLPIGDINLRTETPETSPSNHSGPAPSQSNQLAIVRLGPTRPSDLKKKIN